MVLARPLSRLGAGAVTLVLVAAGLLACGEKPLARAPVVTDPATLDQLSQKCVQESDPKACQTACDSGVAASCNDLGHLYELGVNVTRDGIAASAYYRRACDAGDMGGCFNAGYALENGLGGRQDAGCALALYNYACNGGFTRGCLTAGFMYKSGIDGKKDDKKAIEVFQKACAGGNVTGCNQLKELGQPQAP